MARNESTVEGPGAKTAPSGSSQPSVVSTWLTPILGRDEEIDRIVALLDAGGVRLLTLTGPGGVGKTRLAREVLARVEGEYVDGGVFVPLATLTRADQVPAMTARACGVPDRGVLAAEANLAASLGPRHLLLVLDNYEHQLGEPPVWLVDMLCACPRLTVLTTSRIPLHLSLEQRFPVAPLSVLAMDETETPPAVALFAKRAQLVQPGFVLETANEDVVVELCRQLDGLPLAIELAAARVTVLTPSEMLARISNRLGLLTGGIRDAPERQRSLQATISWSYNLLPDEHQRLFRRLSVFQGGFTLSAAEVTCGPPAGPIADVFGGVAALINHSLLQAAPMPDGATRYRLLETIREFGTERLAASGEEDKVRDAHAAWCLHLAATTVGEGLDNLSRALAIDALEADHANFQAALGWLAGTGQGHRLFRLVSTLEFYWIFGGFETDGLAWYRRALELAPDAATGERLDALLAMSILAHVTDDPAADALIAQATALAWDIGTPYQRGDAAYNVAMRAEDRGDYATGETWFALAHDVFVQTGAEWDIVQCDYHLGVIAFGTGDLALAHERLEAAWRAGIALGDPFTPQWALTYLVIIACEEGDETRATALLREHSTPDHLGYQHHRSVLRVAAGALGSLRGDHEAAVRLFTAANHPVAIYEPEASVARRGLDRARQALGDVAFAAAREGGLRLLPSEIEADIARLAGASGRAPVRPPVEGATDGSLSPRETEVLRLLADGLTNREIADALFISVRTAANHVANILAKLELGWGTAAVAYAIRHDLA